MIIYLLPPEELDDKTLDKQIKAIAQTLVNVHWMKRNPCKVCDEGNDYGYCTCDLSDLEGKPLSPKMNDNFKWDEYSQWASTCLANYKKLVDMGLACCEEYTYRFSDTNELKKIMSTRQLVEHKLQPVIEWARDNVPDLPVNTTCHCFEKDCTHETETPFPLVVPEKYIVYNFTDEPDIEESYRNYYRAMLQKKIKCSKCNGEGWHYPEEEICAHCDQYGWISKITNAKWTRREKPSWLEI